MAQFHYSEKEYNLLTMRHQQQVWQQEHAQGSQLPSEMKAGAHLEPASAVAYFRKFLMNHQIQPPAAVLDIGAGKGRNALYMAQQGFMVTAVDYIPQAVEYIHQLAQDHQLEKNLQAICAPMDEPWPFADETFAASIDSYASIDIETLAGREVYRDELWRTLKTGGLALVTVVSIEDELEAEMYQKTPGSEKNSTIWPDSGKFQKNYDEAELRQFYQKFKILELEKIQKPAHKLGREYLATNFRVILQK